MRNDLSRGKFSFPSCERNEIFDRCRINATAHKFWSARYMPMWFSSRAIVSRAVLICVLLLASDFPPQAQTPAMGRQAGVDNEYQTGAILWTQSSAEYRALAYQTFSLVTLRFEQALANRKSRRSTKPPAIIVDVDETVLDNSRFQAELVLRRIAYTSE